MKNYDLAMSVEIPTLGDVSFSDKNSITILEERMKSLQSISSKLKEEREAIEKEMSATLKIRDAALSFHQNR